MNEHWKNPVYEHRRNPVHEHRKKSGKKRDGSGFLSVDLRFFTEISIFHTILKYGTLTDISMSFTEISVKGFCVYGF